jgi:hypothetical protein
MLVSGVINFIFCYKYYNVWKNIDSLNATKSEIERKYLNIYKLLKYFSIILGIPGVIFTSGYLIFALSSYISSKPELYEKVTRYSVPFLAVGLVLDFAALCNLIGMKYFISKWRKELKKENDISLILNIDIYRNNVTLGLNYKL